MSTRLAAIFFRARIFARERERLPTIGASTEAEFYFPHEINGDRHANRLFNGPKPQEMMWIFGPRLSES
jgi:hypothetical protein